MTYQVASFLGCLFGGFITGLSLVRYKAGSELAAYTGLGGLVIGLACYIVATRIGGVFETRFDKQHRGGLASFCNFAKYTVAVVFSFLLSRLLAMIVNRYAA